MDNSKALGDVIHNFAVKLYQVIGDIIDTKENIVISPISIFTTLFMACVGTRGSTLEESERVLSLAVSDPVWHERMMELQQKLMKSSDRSKQTCLLEVLMSSQSMYTKENVIKEMCNGILISKNFPVREEYLNLATNKFQAIIEEVDFSEFETIRQKFNERVCNLTCGVIKEALPEGWVSRDAAMVLSNTLYFKGPWLVPFLSTNQFTEPFFIDKHHSKLVPVMEKFDYVKMAFFKNLDASAILLPYLDEQYGLLVLLPDMSSSIKETENHLFTLKYTPKKLLQAMHPTKVVIKLPKFKIQFKKDINNILREMGFRQLLSTNSDFSGISPYLDSTVEKKVKVIHQSIIDVNEYGTEAAAFTGVALIPISSEEPFKFTANRPFLYYLVDLLNDAIPLFTGRVVNPLST